MKLLTLIIVLMSLVSCAPTSSSSKKSSTSANPTTTDTTNPDNSNVDNSGNDDSVADWLYYEEDLIDIFESTLGRVPTADEKDYYMYQLISGNISIDQIESELLASNVTSISYNIEVQRVYWEFLKRPAFQAGLEFYVYKLKEGTSYDQVSGEIEYSPESINLQTVYDEYFSRTGIQPDDYVLAFYNNLLNSGESLNSVIARIESGNDVNKIIITKLFLRHLYRMPENAALEYYVNLINAGRTESSIEIEILGSYEYRTYVKVIHDAYLNKLGRLADEAEVSYFKLLLTTGTSERTVVMMINSI